MDFLPVLFLAVLGSVLGSFCVMYFFTKLNLLDNPKRYGFKRRPVPYSAGIILYLLFVLAAIFFLDFDIKLLGVLWGATLLVITSFIDDRFGLSPVLRLFVQVAVVSIIVATGSYILGFNLPFIGWLHLGDVGGRIFTGLWMLGLINVVNWLDGIPGLASGVSGIAFMTLFVLSVLPQIHVVSQEGAATISLLMGVASLIVTMFTWPRLKYLIGDTGSMFLGLMLGVASVYSGGKVATAGLVLFLPLFDAGWTILRRIYSRQSPFKGDMKHLHHRLQRVGINAVKLVGVYLTVTFLLAVGSLVLLSTNLKSFMAVGMFVIMLFLSVVIVYLESKYVGSKG